MAERGLLLTEKDKSRMDWAKHAAFMGEEYMKLV